MGLLDHYQLEPQLLKLEITESAYTDNPRQLQHTIESLQARGFRILMDDFGRGYSSLNMLKNLPVDSLKIDMGFVSDIEKRGRASIIMESVVRLAQRLGMDTVVEGVETQAEIDFLEEIGCRHIQGYYYAKPMDTDAFLQLYSGSARPVQR